MRNFTVALVALAAGFPMTASAADGEALAIGRCDVPAAAPVFSRQSSGFGSGWTITNADGEDPSLPSLMVDGWKPEAKPADKLLAELLGEAGLIYSGPADLPTASWSGNVAPLSVAVSSIVDQFGGDWSFDGKTVFVLPKKLPKTASASVPVPVQRDLRLALVDILRGYDLDVTAGAEAIKVTGSRSEIDKARQGVESATELNVYDVVFLRGRPLEGRYDWRALGAIRSEGRGAGGEFIFSDPEPADLIARMKAAGDLVEDSRQSVAAPKGWSLSVPPAQCGVGTGEVLVGLSGETDALKLDISGTTGQASFDGFSLGTTAATVAEAPANGWISIVLVRPRVIRLAGG